MGDEKAPRDIIAVKDTLNRDKSLRSLRAGIRE